MAVDVAHSLEVAPHPKLLICLREGYSLRTFLNDLGAGTFGLTVLFDLVIAVGTGILLASILFMRRMAQVSTVSGLVEEDAGGADEVDAGPVAQRRVPDGVEVYAIHGPFFFGVANNLRDALDRVGKLPRVVVLRMRFVPHIDATGLDALRRFHERCVARGTVLLLGGVHEFPLREMGKAGIVRAIGPAHIFENLDQALVKARELVGG